MSGICGIYSLDGERPTGAEIEAMSARLQHRGPDCTRHWKGGPVALGHTLLATTPEAENEMLPLTDKGSGCTITADVRLDNRAALISELDLGGATRQIGDGELILKAYLRWGAAATDHLLGDFAFAIWDPRSQSIFCARDQIGMRQLIYHHDRSRYFVFATETQALFGNDLIPKRINDARIADFLDNLEGVDLTSTLFEGVSRLPPAHYLIVSNKGLQLTRYWTLTPPPMLKLKSDKEYMAAFLDVLTEAVRSRLRSAGPVGALLSGGIDSNAVVALAARELEQNGLGPLRTFSGIHPNHEQSIETCAIKAAARMPNLSATLIDPSRLGEARAELVELNTKCDEPFDAPMSLHRAAYLEASRTGTRIMLDGVGGDLVLEPGNIVGELLRRGRLREAVRESLPRRLGLPYALASVRKLFATMWATFVPANIRRMRRRLSWRREDERVANGQDLISRALAEKVRLIERRMKYRASMETREPFGAEYRAATISHPHLVVGRERYDRVAGRFSIEPRDPFLDLRVIKFCLSLPSEQLHSGRFSKIILRRAMVGIVPAVAIWRRDKEHVGWEFTQRLFPVVGPEAACDAQLLRRYVNEHQLDRLSRHALSAVDRLRWYEICVLAHWLAGNTTCSDPVRDQESKHDVN